MLSPFRSLKGLAHEDVVMIRNQRSVIIDGIGVGIVGGIATFLAVFLARLGASPLLVGLLTSMPAFTGLLLAIPVGRMLERQTDIVPWYSRARVWVQATYALTGLLPFFLPIGYVPTAVIVLWAIATIPQTIVNITFTVVMGAAAGPQRRQQLMSWRWSTLGAATAISVAGAGWLLEQFSFPINYQIVFIVSFLGGMLSFFFSSRISIDTTPSSQAHKTGLRALLTESVGMLREVPAFSRYITATFVFNCGIWMAMPLFPLYWVRVVEASDFEIGLVNTVNSGVLLIAYFVWARVSAKRGNLPVLFASTIALSLYPLLTGMTESIVLITILAGLAGFIGSGKDLVFFDLALETMPRDRVPSFVALQQLTGYVATLAMPLVGTFLATQFDYHIALYVAGGLRLAGVVLLYVLKIGRTEQTT
ncbi:MAG: MFS transporter [Chloroflexi bacterium]|nr:MAG: MFS transporter [Chloroflexota bacterium]RLT32863.1 MAG: MFS transporter [Chloroflexota bacterium]